MPIPHPLIFDGHNDSIQALYPPDHPRRNLLEESPDGHLDLPRAKRGGFGGGMFAIFVPSPSPGATVDPSQAQEITEMGMRRLLDLETKAKGRLRIIRDVPALRRAFQEQVLAAVMHLEGAEAIDPGLERLEEYYLEGMRSLGLVWSRPNVFGTGVNFTPGSSPDQGPGLTQEGRALVKACNRLGILVDLSHLNEKGFWDVAEISSAPLVASHSCVYSLSPSPRNLTDKQLDAIGASGGLVGINFAVGFLRADNKNDPETPMSEMVRHFQYIADRIGIEHVAFGSDFDGCTISRELGDVCGLPRLLDALLQAGFAEEALRKIAHLNWMRVLDATWRQGACRC